MFTAAEIFVLKNDLIVIADEIYEDIFYGSEPPLSIASLPGMQERTVVVGGFSKTYAMTSWRVGYAVVPTPLYASVQKIHQYAVTCVSTFCQVGIANSIDRCSREVQEIRGLYKNFLCNLAARDRKRGFAPARFSGRFILIRDTQLF